MSEIRIGKRTIELSNEDKVFYPGADITKGDVVGYYRRVYEYMAPHLNGRPLTFERYPDGIEGKHFFQKNASDYFPDWIRSVELEKEDGRVDYVVTDDEATLAYLADQAALVFHIFLSKADAPHKPDRFIFDLDPSAEDFGKVRKAALILNEKIAELGMAPFVMTTGSRGLHVTTPIKPEHDFDDVRAFAGKIAQKAVNNHPEELTLEQRKENRGNRIYLDIMRNAYGQTGVCPYTLRALPNAPVATPLDWDEVSNNSLMPGSFTIANIFRRLGQKPDPWKDFSRYAVSLPG